MSKVVFISLINTITTKHTNMKYTQKLNIYSLYSHRIHITYTYVKLVTKKKTSAVSGNLWNTLVCLPKISFQYWDETSAFYTLPCFFIRINKGSTCTATLIKSKIVWVIRRIWDSIKAYFRWFAAIQTGYAIDIKG